MDDGVKAGEVLGSLRERYGFEELTDLSRASGIPRATLKNWQDKPGTVVRSPGRKYLREAVAPAVDLPAAITALLAGQQRIEQRLDALMTLRSEPGRLEQMVTAKSKAKKAGGGAA